MEDKIKKLVSYSFAEGVHVQTSGVRNIVSVLTPDALAFVMKLEREFGDRRRKLLKKRVERQIEINSGKMPDFLPETEQIRTGNWKVADCAPDLIDRRVEVIGPPERSAVIAGLNSGANVYIADFENTFSPTWNNIIEGHRNLQDAVNRTLSITLPNGRRKSLHNKTAALMVCPRGWHLEEKHVTVDGQPVSASLFDFGIFFFHNARKLIDGGSGPYFYLPKLENRLEAEIWNDVFAMAQDELGIPAGYIRATVSIENILAAFEMHEILYELKEYSAGLSCGRWDYIFSFVKKFRYHLEFLLPDRGRITMMTHFLRSYSALLIQTCHRHGAHAIGGMTARIPVIDDPEATEETRTRVRLDKVREVADGHDGTWVGHPDLVAVARSVFDEKMTSPNQIHRKREDANILAADLLTIPKGEITENGIRLNIAAALRFIESWLNGAGCLSVGIMMENTATVEICRAQLWQWVHSSNAIFSGHRRLNAELFDQFLSDELNSIRDTIGNERYVDGKYHIAVSILKKLVLGRDFAEFLTLEAYEHIE
jgi:malate synthase